MFFTKCIDAVNRGEVLNLFLIFEILYECIEKKSISYVSFIVMLNADRMIS